MLDTVILPHFFHLKNMLPDSYLCLHFIIFIGFSHYRVININQFHFRWNIIRFYLRRNEIEKTLNASRIFDIIFWSAFLSSVYFKHSFAYNPFPWVIGLSQISNFPACRVQLLNGDVFIVLFLLMVVGMTELVAGFFRAYLWILTRYVYS